MNRLVKILLFPFSLIYGLAVLVRNFLFDHSLIRSTEFSFPVISVGNISAGGTGKTPHVEYIIGLLSDQFRVAVLSRGYMRKSRGFRIVETGTPVSESGDEPQQLKRKFPEVVVAVDADRVRGIREIITRFPEVQVVLLDDAFQHRHVTPGFSILLTDFSNLFTRDHLLPSGRLREHRINRRRADIILVTRSPEKMSPMERRLIAKEIDPAPFQNLYFTTVVYRDPVNIFSPDAASVSLPEMGTLSTSVLLLTGIAYPEPFIEHISGACKNVTHLEFPDHHWFTSSDLKRIAEEYDNLPAGNRCIITTEKDAARLSSTEGLASLLDDNIFYIPIVIGILNDDSKEFDNHILDYVRKNKPNSKIS